LRRRCDRCGFSRRNAYFSRLLKPHLPCIHRETMVPTGMRNCPTMTVSLIFVGLSVQPQWQTHIPGVEMMQRALAKSKSMLGKRAPI
jgi:hypothetical protein